MVTEKNVSLKRYNTFGLDYKADFVVHINTTEEAVSIFRDKHTKIDNLRIIGGGSNLLFTNDFAGTIVHPVNKGIQLTERIDEDVIVTAGAGVIWDELVNWSVENDLGGLENLSLIPGNVGATPVQNIGAYGAEVKDTIERVIAISVKDGSIREFNNEECKFGYRNSIFKNELKNCYLVWKVCFRLKSNPILRLDYGSLNDEIAKLGDTSLKNIRQAVINIRSSKLPDPAILGNAGSFYKNPVVNSDLARDLKSKYSQMPSWEDPSGGIKLAAGWLIEQCGWKGKKVGNTGVHEKQALVIVNYGNATGTEILNLSVSIKKSVHEEFGIELESEVEII
jgi:UDP-N-acetylmuramate dehydrogenase